MQEISHIIRSQITIILAPVAEGEVAIATWPIKITLINIV